MYMRTQKKQNYVNGVECILTQIKRFGEFLLGKDAEICMKVG